MAGFDLEKMLKKIEEVGVVKKNQNVEQVISELNEFEKQREIKLPEEYKQFLIRYSSLSLKDDYCYKPLEKNPWTPEDGYETVDLFYGFSNDKYDLRKMAERYSDQITKACVPIAELSGGNQLCLRVLGQDNGKVYFWDHESNNPEKTYGYLSANSFLELIMSFEAHSRKSRVDLSQIKITLSDDLL